MAKAKAPFRYDIVGSFLRPEWLKQKRAAFAAGEISAAELKQAEDEAIGSLIAKEKELGLKAVTDGEFRRRYWHLDFLASLNGIEEVKAEEWSVKFKGKQPKAATIKIVNKIGFDSDTNLFLEHFKGKIEYLMTGVGQCLHQSKGGIGMPMGGNAEPGDFHMLSSPYLHGLC